MSDEISKEVIEFDATRDLDAIDWAILYQEWQTPKVNAGDIAEKLGLSYGVISRRRNSYRLRRAREQFFKGPTEMVQAAMSEAAMVVIEALRSPDERVRVGTALKMLYSHGVLKREPSESGQESEVLVISTSRENLMIGTKEAITRHGGDFSVPGSSGVS